MSGKASNKLTAPLREVDHHIAGWLLEVARTEHTAEAYRHDVNAFLDMVGVAFDAVTPGDLKRYQDSLTRYALTTRQRKIAALRSFYDYLNGLEVTDVNLSRFKGPRIKRQIDKGKMLTPKEIEGMVAAAENDPTAYLLVRFLYTTGARISEAVGIKWRDLTPKANGGEVIVYGKGNKWRKLPIRPDVWRDIAASRGAAQDADRIFPAIRDRYHAARVVAGLAKAARIDKHVSPHSFRHACASHLLDRGANVAAVRDLLGHSSLSTTNLYADPPNIDGLAELLD